MSGSSDVQVAERLGHADTTVSRKIYLHFFKERQATPTRLGGDLEHLILGLAPCDLSHVNWILTANSLDRLPAPLRSRLDIVQVEGPSPMHFDCLLSNLLEGTADAWGLPQTLLPDLEPEAEQLLRARFTRHRSVRRLERELRAAMAAGISAAPRLTN
jgi:hypothetical protein